jgi:hypothetical protein
VKYIKIMIASLMFSLSFVGMANAVTYSESTVDGKSPLNSQLGCSQDAVTMRSTYLFDKWGSKVGYLELRYSLKCHSAWARLTNYYDHVPFDTHSGKATIKRFDSPTGNNPSYSCYTPAGVNQYCFTDMVYDLDPRKAQASALIDAYDSYYGTIEAKTTKY